MEGVGITIVLEIFPHNHIIYDYVSTYDYVNTNSENKEILY